MASSRVPLQSRGNLQGATKKNTARPRGPPIDRLALLDDLRSISENFASPECQVDVVESDLTNPTAESVKEVYCMLLNALFRLNPVRFKEVPLARKAVQHPELYEVFWQQQQYIRTTSRVMSSIEVPNGIHFEASDLFTPEPKRTVRLFASIVNFIKFSNYLADQLNSREIEEQTKQAQAKLEEMTQKKMELSDQKHRLEKQKVDERELEEELKRKLAEEENGVLQLKQQQEQLSEQLKKLEERKQTIDTRAAELKEHYAQCQRRVEDLQLDVVTSPEELEAEVALAHKQEEEAKSYRDDAVQLVSKWESVATRAQEVPPVIASVSEETDKLIPKAKLSNQAMQNLEALEETLSKQKQELKELSAKLQNLTKKLKLTEEESTQLSIQKQRQPDMHCLSDELNRDVKLLQQQLSTKIARDSKMKKEIEEETKVIQRDRQRLEKQKTEASLVREQLEKTFLSLRNRMDAATSKLDHYL